MVESVVQTILDSGALDALLTGMLTALTAVFTYLGAVAQEYFKKMAEEKKIKHAQECLKVLDGVIDTTVDALNGTVKAELLEKAADGRLTKEEGADLLAHAIMTIRTTITPSTQEAIELLVTDLDEYIRLRIEAKLVAQKAEMMRAEKEAAAKAEAIVTEAEITE